MLHVRKIPEFDSSSHTTLNDELIIDSKSRRVFFADTSQTSTVVEPLEQDESAYDNDSPSIYVITDGSSFTVNEFNSILRQYSVVCGLYGGAYIQISDLEGTFYVPPSCQLEGIMFQHNSDNLSIEIRGKVRYCDLAAFHSVSILGGDVYGSGIWCDNLYIRNGIVSANPLGLFCNYVAVLGNSIVQNNVIESNNSAIPYSFEILGNNNVVQFNRFVDNEIWLQGSSNWICNNSFKDIAESVENVGENHIIENVIDGTLDAVSFEQL